MKKIIIKNKGSIALVSIIVISAMLLIVTIGASESQISTSDQQVNSFSNKSSYYISEACLEEVFEKIKTNANYSGGTINLEIEDASCEASITGDSTKTISITTVYEDYTQNYQAQISITTNGQANNIRLLNWHKN